MAVAKNRSLMGKEPFESFFQEGLKNHEIEVDTQSIWDGIEPSLPPASSGTVWPWWGIAGLLIVAGSVLAVFQGFGEDEVSSSEIATYQSSEGGTSPSMDATASLLKKDEVEDQSKVNTRKDTEIEMGVMRSTPLMNEKYSVSDQNEDKEKNEGVMEEATERRIQLVERGSSGRLSSVVVGQLPQKGNGGVDILATASNDQALTSITGSGESRAGMTLDQISSFSTPVSQNEGSLNEEMSILRNKYAELDALQPLAEVSGVTWSSVAPSILPPKGLDCYDFRNWSLAWSIDAYAGFHYAGKSLSDNNIGGEADEYIQARENTESYLEAFDAGLTVNVMHRKGYLASVGINYSQINEKFNFFTVNSTTRFDSVPVRINIDSAGMADTVKAWRPVTIQSTEERLTYNSYRMVDVPIALGYHFFNGKWSYEVRAGVMFNLLFQQKGEILNDQLVATSIESGDIFRSQVGLSLFGGIKILYPINKRFSAFVEPVGRFNLVPVTVDSYALTQRYNQFGVRLGARLHL
jgi:hypothetical protein